MHAIKGMYCLALLIACSVEYLDDTFCVPITKLFNNQNFEKGRVESSRLAARWG